MMFLVSSFYRGTGSGKRIPRMLRNADWNSSIQSFSLSIAGGEHFKYYERQRRKIFSSSSSSPSTNHNDDEETTKDKNKTQNITADSLIKNTKPTGTTTITGKGLTNPPGAIAVESLKTVKKPTKPVLDEKCGPLDADNDDDDDYVPMIDPKTGKYLVYGLFIGTVCNG